MAELTLKTSFELKGLNKKDIKGGKSTTTKTYISRAKREELERRQRILKELNDIFANLNKMTVKQFGDRRGYFNAYTSKQVEELYHKDIKYYSKCIAETNTLISEMETAIQTGVIPDHAWCLWFAFDYEATKVYGEEAKRLFNLLSDGKDHNIKGEIKTGENQYEIISWEEF